MKELLAIDHVVVTGGFLLTLLVVSSSVGSSVETATFGPRVDRILSFEAGTMFVIHTREHQRPQIGVAELGRLRVNLYSLNDKGEVTQSQSLKTLLPVSNVVPMSDDRLVFFSEETGKVSLFNTSDFAEELLRGTFPKDADGLAVVDIDKNGWNDFLFFGKERSGVATYLGKGEGVFVRGETLFGDFSISDLEALDVNRDGIVDLFVTDWLSNQLLLYNGIGHGSFSEQVSLSLPGEPGDISLLKRESAKTFRVGVAFPDLNEVRTFTVNAMGTFVPEATLRCNGSPQGIDFADVSNDGRPDVLIPLENGILVFTEDTEGHLSDPAFFSVGGRMGEWIIDDVSGDSIPEAVFLSPEAHLLTFLGNCLSPSTATWPATFAVGISPQGIATGDFNADHLTDVAVLNGGSDSFSMLVNQGHGRFNVLPGVGLPEMRSTVSTVSDSSRFAGTFVASGSSIRWIPNKGPTSAVLLPLSDPSIVFAEFPADGDRLAFLVRSREGNRGSFGLSLFDQIGGDQYIETRLFSPEGSFITAITAYDILGNRLRDLVFAAVDHRKGLSSVFVAEAETRFSFLASAPVLSLPDSIGLIDMIIPARVDTDSRTDLMLGFGEPEQSIAILFGDSATLFEDSVEWIRSAKPLHSDACIIQDLNNDKRTDLCLLDETSRSVVAYFGTGKGRDRRRKIICPADDVSSIAVAFLNENRRYDLILSHLKKGTVSILFDPF